MNKKQNENLIIFFNGWGMNEQVVSHLLSDSYDIIMFYDYRNLNTDFDFSLLNDYKNNFLVSWSMGVFVSNLFAEYFKSTNKSVAVNGTLCPVNNSFGIPEKIYDLTVNNFNETSCKKFVQRMFVNENFELVFDRNISELKEELIAIRECSNSDSLQFIQNNKEIDTVRSFIKYDKAIICDNDKIIPAKNQINFWQSQKNTEIKILHYGHCPFFNFSSWDEIING